MAHVQDADDLVDLAFVDRQLVVIAGGQLVLDFLDRHGQVQRLDLGARGHDVLDRDVLQVEQVEQDALVLLRDEVAAFEHDGAQFFGRHALLGWRRGRLMRSSASTAETNRLTNQISGLAMAISGRSTVAAAAKCFPGSARRSTWARFRRTRSAGTPARRWRWRSRSRRSRRTGWRCAVTSAVAMALTRVLAIRISDSSLSVRSSSHRVVMRAAVAALGHGAQADTCWPTSAPFPPWRKRPRTGSGRRVRERAPRAARYPRVTVKKACIVKLVGTDSGPGPAQGAAARATAEL